MTDVELLENIYFLVGCIFAVVLMDFTFKWAVKPLMDWVSSLFSEGVD